MTPTAIVYENPDGTIRYSVPAKRSKLFNENQREWLNAVEQHERRGDPKLEGAARLRDCPIAELPMGRFRGCWRNDGAGGVHVDMPLARAQRMVEIRGARNARLTASDALMARARDQEKQAEIEALKAMRQALRDIPQHMDLTLINDPAELEAFEPDWPAGSAP